MKWIKSPDIRAIGILLLLWLLFFWRLLTPIVADQASFKQGDFSGQFVAFGAYQYERFTAGEIPLWNPYNNGGLPFIADTQAAVFYPPRLLTIFLSNQINHAWSYHALELEAIFHVLAYSLLMYLFLRRLIASRWGAFLGTIVAAYGGFISGYPPLQLALLEAAIWLPLAALGILEATGRNTLQWRWLLLAAFALGLSWMAGHPQTSWFGTYFIVAWFIYRVYLQKIAWKSFVLGFILLGLVTVGITAVTLLPGAEYLLLASRSNMGFDGKGNGFPFQDLAQFIFPHLVSLFSPLYVGIPALILIYIALRYQWKQSFFWGLLAAIALIHSFGANTVLYYALYNPLPGLRFFRGQERAVVLVAFALATLAAIGMSHFANWSQNEKGRDIQRLLIGLVIFIGGITSLIFIAWLGNIGNFGQVISTVSFSSLIIGLASILFFWQIQTPNRNALILLTLLLIFELFSVNIDAPSNYDSIPAENQLSMIPPPLVQTILTNTSSDLEPYRVDGFRGLGANYGSLYGLMDIRGISPLFLQSAYELIYHDYVNNPRAWEVLAVRYIFSERETFGQIETRVISEGEDDSGHVYLHEVLNPRPFAHLIYDYDVITSDAHALELLHDPNYQARDKIILEQIPNLILPEIAPIESSARVVNFAPESFLVEINTSENAILSLALVDYPGWQASLDGNPVEILRAYGSLTAIEIPAGEHQVRLSYEPKSYLIGATVSLITWISLAIVLLYSLLRTFVRR